jgi:hypothetical protein
MASCPCGSVWHRPTDDPHADTLPQWARSHWRQQGSDDILETAAKAVGEALADAYGWHADRGDTMTARTVIISARPVIEAPLRAEIATLREVLLKAETRVAQFVVALEGMVANPHEIHQRAQDALAMFWATVPAKEPS